MVVRDSHLAMEGMAIQMTIGTAEAMGITEGTDRDSKVVDEMTAMAKVNSRTMEGTMVGDEAAGRQGSC